MAKKKDSLIEHTKESVKIGIVGGAGLGAMGAMSNISGMPAAAGRVTQAAGAGVTLAGVGKVTQIGMSIPKLMKGEPGKKKKTGDKYINRII